MTKLLRLSIYLHLFWLSTWQVYCPKLGVELEPGQSSSADQAVCQTEACQWTATLLKENIDFEVDPCQDFYQHACGKVIRNGLDGSIRKSLNNFEESERQIKELGVKLIEDEHEFPSGTSRDMIRIRAYFASCMSGAGTSSEHLAAVVSQIGGFPLQGDVSAWRAEGGWIELMAKLSELGLSYSAFFTFEVHKQPDDLTKIQLEVGAPSRLSDWTEERRATETTKYLAILSELNGDQLHQVSSETRAQLERLFSFRKKLALTYKDFQGDYNDLTVAALASRQRPDELNWMQLIERLLPGVPVFRDTRFIISAVNHLVSPLVAHTNPEVLANHLIMFALEELLDNVRHDDDTRRAQCLDHVRLHLGHALAHEIGSRFGIPEVRQQVLRMVAALKSRFIHTIAESGWITTPSKIEAFKKIRAIRVYVGHSDGFMQQAELEDRFYQGIELDEGQFMQNYLKLARQATVRMIKLANEPFEQALDSEADGHVLSNLAAYSYNNIIYIMTGNLKGFFFQLDRPNYINYGSLGVIIAHELSHAFDPTHVERDSECKQTCWWDYETDKAYKSRLRCLIRQYDQLDLPEIGFAVDGRETLNENLADNIGPAIAWAALSDLTARTAPEPLLPGLLGLNQKQLFWLYYGASWCENLDPTASRKKYELDMHSPPKLRVNLALSNMAEFAKAFNCKPGSPMNPTEGKCPLFE